MNQELKKAICQYMFDKATDFQLVNNTTEHFRQYVYTPDGNYCFGGEIVSDFISQFSKLIKL